MVRILSEDQREALAERWAAHSTRRGPLVAADNAKKLDDMLEKIGIAEAARDDIFDGLTDVAAHYWQYEGHPMEAIADEYEDADTQGRPPDPQRAIVPSLIDHLERLENSAALLRGLLRAL
jgi:hypothetical protein